MAMILDRLLPECDATRIEHRVIPGTRGAVFEAVRQADFMETWRHNPAVRAVGELRSALERLAAVMRGGAQEGARAQGTLRLAAMPEHGEWVLLGSEPPDEIAFGAIGRFWAGETAWREIDAAQFATFSEPGYAKIACNFSLRPYGDTHTLVSYEARTQATDATARRAFLRYWRFASAGAGLVMRGQLATIDRAARGSAS